MIKSKNVFLLKVVAMIQQIDIFLRIFQAINKKQSKNQYIANQCLNVIHIVDQNLLWLNTKTAFKSLLKLENWNCSILMLSSGRLFQNL